MLTNLLCLGLLFIGFGVAARLWPCNRTQPAFITKDLLDNVLWWLLGIVLGAFVYGDLAAVYIRGIMQVVAPHQAAQMTAWVLAGHGWAARLPLALQVLAVLALMDFVQYWLHRAYHGRWLWPFHAVHHSAEELDWSATFRVHPVNFVLYSAGALAIVRAFGFAPAAFGVIGPWNLIYGALVHANLNWTFGPCRYVLASPVYHRWHHVKDPRVHDKNFAPTFPVLDLMFGTFHMPKGELPADFGVEGAPRHFARELVYPFIAVARQMRPTRKVRAREAAA